MYFDSLIFDIDKIKKKIRLVLRKFEEISQN
jgi:hypothetical protein